LKELVTKVTKVKPNINSVEVHPQLNNSEHPVDGALVGAGSLQNWSLIVLGAQWGIVHLILQTNRPVKAVKN
jgi:hypothetical protein